MVLCVVSRCSLGRESCVCDSLLTTGLWLCFLAHRILHSHPAPDPDAPWPPLLL
uniref:Uncharacterized protein n=1 Tax=Trichinella nativa TaxID=6335 RepID=A0A0V1KID7_9BILA